MKTRVQKWGNSLALRIPKSFAAETHMEQDSIVDISLVDGKLLISPERPRIELNTLLEGITPENMHQEIDFGPAVGGEIW